MQLSGWVLVVALVLLVGWVLAGLLGLLNVWLVLRTRGGVWFQLVNLAVALGYFVWGLILFCGLFQNVYFIMVSTVLIPVCVFVHTGFLMDMEKRFRVDRVSESSDTG